MSPPEQKLYTQANLDRIIIQERAEQDKESCLQCAKEIRECLKDHPEAAALAEAYCVTSQGKYRSN